MNAEAQTPPGIDRAYDFVVPSYNWMLQRLEASNARMQSLQTFAATITFAAPAVARALSPDVNLKAPLFLAALALFAVIGLGGVLVRLSRKGIRLVNPGELAQDDWLSLPDQRFKLEMVKAAGLDMTDNTKLVTFRANFSDFLTFVFGVEVILLALWARTEL